MGFVHLHVHTQYSLLQGAIRVDELCARVKELGMTSVAMTDTHQLFGAIDFYYEAKSEGLKPIIGTEVFFEAERAPGEVAPRFHHHLVLLCKNQQGYQNLCKLLTDSYLRTLTPPSVEGVEKPEKKHKPGSIKPVITRELLEKYREGLIVLSGCMKGEIAHKVLMGNEAGATECIRWFKSKFGEDFYLELQDSPVPEQDLINETLERLGERLGVVRVATTDCHYLKSSHCESHEVLVCIEQGKNLDFDRPKSLVEPIYYLKSEEEMRVRFERFSGACDATVAVAEKCNLEFRFKDEEGRPIYHLPKFRPDGVSKEDPFDLIAYFHDQSKAGLIARFAEPIFAEKLALPNWPELRAVYEARLSEELAMIERTGFAGYFLIVADFIGYAKSQGIPVGPGRGSGAGSLVAYVLQITDIDPIEFKLLFERFINPERISMPDFDIDFCQDRRSEVIEYVMRKYGASNVAQIITFGKLQARAAIKDVGRVMGLSFAETDQLTKLMPDELNITLKSALEKEPRLRERIEADPKAAMLFQYALELEGLFRNAGTHAAGVIITEEPVVNYCPLFVGREGDIVTQFDKDFAEKIGLVKFDFLGLKTLTVIDNAVKLIRKSALSAPEGNSMRAHVEFQLSQINYKDPAVFSMISSGDTDGVFQLESDGMKDLCIRIRPEHLEDITAINALYRPGPLGSGMVDDFIDRKHGRKAMEYEIESLGPILKDTYGVILYQEQVMQIARELAGYSLGQADLLRRAMGKKKADEMAMNRDLFVAGAAKNAISGEKSGALFDLIAKFAEYGFNKSHSAAYGVLTYQTAYLKQHFPAEFMAALMTTEMDNTDKLKKYIQNSLSIGLSVLPPDLNYSDRRFKVEWQADGSRAIRFGLEGIKGVGGAAVDVILESAAAGEFRSVIDFFKRISTRKVNKKVLESLIYAGAFDGLCTTGVNRPSLLASLESLIEFSAAEQEERDLGQVSLFDQFQSQEIKPLVSAEKIIQSQPDWPGSRKLVYEKQVMGIYLSGNPMDRWQSVCESWLETNIEKLNATLPDRVAQAASNAGGGGGYGSGYGAPRIEVKVAGMVSEFREVMTKKGSRMGFGRLEDLTSSLELVIFPEAYQQLGERIKRALDEVEVVVVAGEARVEEGLSKILVRELEIADEAYKDRVERVVIRIPENASVDHLRALKRELVKHRGKVSADLIFEGEHFRTSMKLPQSLRVAGTAQLASSINKVFGREVVQLVTRA